MHNQSVNELRFLFLEQIAIETPEAAARLFELRDTSKWQAEYHLAFSGASWTPNPAHRPDLAFPMTGICTSWGF